MKIVTVARRPCLSSTVTKNVLDHEVGALNIDATRLGDTKTEGLRGEERGRWPANALLQHEPGCRPTGTVKVEGYRINRWSDGAKPFGGGAGHPYDSELLPEEEVILWSCTPVCAVAFCNQQGGGVSLLRRNAPEVSRFFKQVQAMNPDIISQELWDYLVMLISPPPGCSPVIIAEENLGAVDFSRYENASVHGMLSMGDPTPWMEEIDRILRPGAHFLILSDEEDPTGATNACAVEDFGYEIRDAIAILDTAGEFTYSSKASKKERNDGVVPREKVIRTELLFPKDANEVGDLREELREVVPAKFLKTMVEKGIPSDLVPEEMLDQFEVRVEEVRREVRNDHVTLKPIDIMVALLEDIPAGGLVVDPFQGSGTTGIACLRTGHDYVGIEQDPDSLTIADQRIRHWNRKRNAWNGARIESEAAPPENELDPTGGVFDIFGGDP